jgi:hypothetical protein
MVACVLKMAIVSPLETSCRDYIAYTSETNYVRSDIDEISISVSRSQRSCGLRHEVFPPARTLEIVGLEHIEALMCAFLLCWPV